MSGTKVSENSVERLKKLVHSKKRALVEDAQRERTEEIIDLIRTELTGCFPSDIVSVLRKRYL